MPSNKKKSVADKRRRRQARLHRKSAVQELRAVAAEFRGLLLSGRREYSKGRAYDAVELQERALVLGSEGIPRFDDDSLAKAHALVELALAKSAIQTDFAAGEEWEDRGREAIRAVAEALEIFENRARRGTLNKFRKEECWIDASGGDYASPVPHTERMGPVDYLQCVKLFASMEEPTMDTVRSIKVAIDFVRKFQATGHVIVLEAGAALQGMLPPGELDNLNRILRAHDAVVKGHCSRADAMDKLYPSNNEEEFRHTGSLAGRMKDTYKKLARDADKVGRKQCVNPSCGKLESQPKQFSTCSRCKWATYCCRDCQLGDWKRHKKECRSGEAARKAQEEETQNRAKSCLLVGQSQQVMTIIAYVHQFAATSDEMKRAGTKDAALVLSMVTPQFDGLEMGSVLLGMRDASLVWNAIWSLENSQLRKMFAKFLAKMSKFWFPKGGPDFGVVADWGSRGVSGDFAVVEHTERGTILLHEDPRTGDIKAYVAVGITQSLESIMVQMADALPIHVNTALLPFKNMVLCQGTISGARGVVSAKLRAAAEAFVKGDHGEMQLIESIEP